MASISSSLTYGDYLRLLQQAAFLNTAGVMSLLTNNDDASTDTCLYVFNEALGLMEQISACPDLEKVGSKVPQVWNALQAPQLQDDRFFICPEALMFAVADDKPVISEVDLSFYSAVIIFNMALAYHQRSLREQQQQLLQGRQEEMLQNALHLYEHCQQILGTILSPPGDDTDRLKLVALNNQAQIHYRLQNFARFHELLQEIRQLCPVLLMRSKGAAGEGSVFHNSKTMREISMNALLVTGPPSAAASA